MNFLRRHRTAIASTVVVGIASALLVTYALSSDGHPVRQVELDDGGIWVTSDGDGLFGRLNRPAGSLDAAFYPPGGAQQAYQLDIVQDGGAVVARDRGTGALYPVDVARGVTLKEQQVPLPQQAQVGLAGGTIAALDPTSGAVWAKRVDISVGVTALNELDAASPPVAEVGENGSLAVGLDGTVHAVSPDGAVATVVPDGLAFTAAAYTRLATTVREPLATAVGSHLVVLDAASGTVVLPDGRTASVDGAGPVPQQPGPSADRVVVATESSLTTVTLADGATEELSAEGGGAPTAPVRLGDCVHAAWAGDGGGYRRSCGGAPATQGNLRDPRVLVRPVFRVNRASIVLNDLATGAVWELSTQRKVDDWSAVKPPPVADDSDRTKDDRTTDDARDTPPKAVDDTLGARPGRTTVLHVLDNDSDPSGDILSISAITQPDGAAATLSIAPDGQTVQVGLPDGDADDVSFTYTIDDGKGLTATAAVTVQARATTENEPPAPRVGHTPREWPVSAGGLVSLPVLADWRDFDGDPVALVGASADGGSVTTTATGFVEFRAPLEPGVRTVSYQVSDGRGAAVDATVAVTVLGVDAAAVAATAQPDVARGEVGRPVLVRPLDNDVPGSDPTAPDAVLAIAANPPSPPGATVVTDPVAGTVTITAARVGSFLIGYSVAFGSAPFATGAIRVDVVAAPATPAPPVAVPDQAVLFGQTPATVDVLANDVSPSGSLLVVQQATVTGDDPQVQVAIVRGRWLRINALSPTLTPNPQVVRYTVTDGVTGPVTGEVTVTQLAAPVSDAPVPKDDIGTVRAGDVVTLPVLDNDTTPTGSAITLRPDVEGAPEPGQLTVTARNGSTDGVGSAYVSGSTVRYVAPPSVDAPLVVAIEYVAQNPAGDQATGTATVTVNPAPTPTTPNQPPAPRGLDARAVAGDTVVVRVPTTGVDPDGDSVTVTGIGSASQLGRVLRIGATSIEYQAYPTSAGTDAVTYLVTDRYGGVGEATVRIAVVPPGQPQPAVAVDDALTAAPGARLAIDLLSNDLYGEGDPVEAAVVGEPGDGVAITPEGLAEVTAPDLSGKPLVVPYSLAGGIGEPSVATLTVRSQDGHTVPPVAGDAVAEQPEPGATTVRVDVLAKSGDRDGDADDIEITRVFDPAGSFDGPNVTVPVADVPRAIAYEIADADGATAVGLVHVPAVGGGAPYVRPGTTIEVPVDGAVTVAIADHVIDPAGKPLTLTTTDKIWASPSAGLQARDGSATELALTARGGYAGPAAITFQVTNGTSITDPAGITAIVTIPVQVGPDTPFLRCPDSAIPVVAGGDPVDVDVTSVCHVWVVDPANLEGLRYTAAWRDEPAGVEVGGGGSREVSITASGSAVPESSGVLDIGVDGFDGITAQLTVRVLAAPPPSVTPVTVDGVKAGDTATVDLGPYVRSRLRDPAFSVLSVTQSGGLGASATADGTTVRITPDADAHGTMTFAVVATDVADTSRIDRHATGQITLRVLGVPDAPGAPSPGRTVLSKVVELSWPTPANNGAPVEAYEVDYGRGTQTCAASPCAITNLQNGVEYTFRVRARNLVGWGEQSAPSAPAQPNTVPGAVTGLATSDPEDGTLRLTWAEPPNEGTPVQRYEVSWTGGGRATAAGTSLTATGLDNESRHTFTVIAVNSQGPGPAATVDGQSAGAPLAPDAPTFTATNVAGSAQRAVQVSWVGVSPNGPGPTTYSVSRTGGSGPKAVCTDVTATTCADDGLANDGTIYTYTVTAANQAAVARPAGHTSPPSAGARMEATATPGTWGSVSASATGNDGEARLQFDVPPSYGRESIVQCRHSHGSCGDWAGYPTGGQGGVQRTVTGLPNGAATTFTLTLCNGGGASDAYAGNPCNAPANSNPITAYGPIHQPGASASPNGQNVNWSVSVNPNGRPATVNIQTSAGRNETYTTGVGGWSHSGTDGVGWSTNYSITITVSDAGRATQSASASTRTPDRPPEVHVSRGAPCPPGGCSGTCTSSECGYIVVETRYFPGSVTCTFNSSAGAGGFVNQNFGPNERRQTGNYFGYPNGWVTATCGGVTGQSPTWRDA